MIEIFPILINEYIKNPPQDEVVSNKKTGSSQKAIEFKKQKRNISYNVNYSNAVFTTTTEKTILKLIIRNEWKNVNINYIQSLKSFDGDAQEEDEYKKQYYRKEKVCIFSEFKILLYKAYQNIIILINII